MTYQNYKPIKIKKQNTVLLPYNTIVAAYPLMKKDEIQKILDTTQFEIAFFTDSSNENDIPRFKAKVNIDARENYSKEINEQHIVNYGPLLSDDLFQTFKEQSIYTYSFLFDDKSIYDINASLFDRHIKLNNIYYTYSNTIAAQVSKFNDVFKILNEFCLVLSVCIIIYYAFSIIKDNKYNIGVLKSLGYRGNELSVFFFSSFMIYFAATGCLLGIIFDRMTSLLNKVLIYNLTTRKITTKITSIPIVAFDLKIFLIILISLLTLTLLFSLIYLFILRKFKIIKVIQNKE